MAEAREVLGPERSGFSHPATGAAVWLATVAYGFLMLMPGLVGGMVDHLGFSPQAAGWVATAHMFGVLVGALGVALFIGRVRFRFAATLAVLLLAGADAGSATLTTVEALVAARVLAGVGGGVAMGIASAVIARTRHPDRIFGWVLCAQFVLGATGLAGMPYLLASTGTPGAFVALACLSGSAVLAALRLPGRVQEERLGLRQWEVVFRPASLLTLLSMLVFWACSNSVWAYLDRIGVAVGISVETVGLALGMSALGGIFGAAAAGVVGTKLGRALPITAGSIGVILSTAVLLGRPSQEAFFGAGILMYLSWGFVAPYYLGLGAALDPEGQVMVLANFVVGMGLVLGPACGALLVGDNDYFAVVTLSIAGCLVSTVTILAAVRLHVRAARVVGQGR